MSRVDFSGQTVCHNNVATSYGGCIDVLGADVTVNGPLCAYDNSAQFGGFASVRGGVMRLNAPVTTVDNTRNTIFVAQVNLAQGNVTCGSDAPWAYVQVNSYNITGRLCACNSEFIAGNSSTCDTCEGAGRDSSLCACVSASASQAC